MERRMRRGLTLLMYHRILPMEECRSYPLASLVIPVDVFRCQLHWLYENCMVLPVEQALARLDSQESFKKPLVALTFDDGYVDNYELAASLLEEHGLRATFFITTGFVESQRPLWYDRAADAWMRVAPKDRTALMDSLRPHTASNLSDLNGIQLWMAALKTADPKVRMEMVDMAESFVEGENSPDMYRPMTIAQVRELHDRGHEIGSHTVTHPILPQLDNGSLKEELERSSACIREWTGGDIKGFCYPNGDFDQRVEHAVAEAGYGYACTMQTGFNQPPVRMTRLSRLPVTMQRMVRSDGSHDQLGFRAELCRLREWWR